MPGIASFATVIFSLPFAASTETPFPLAQTLVDASSVPAAATSAVVPRWAPGG